jgi:acetone carboxylase gamma subunit
MSETNKNELVSEEADKKPQQEAIKRESMSEKFRIQIAILQNQVRFTDRILDDLDSLLVESEAWFAKKNIKNT